MILESIRLGLRALAANKLRAALTMLGITIGVGAVITLVSVGNAVSRYVADQFAGLGTNILYIFPGQFQRGGPPSRTATTVLTERDALALADPARVPDAARVVPLIQRNVPVARGREPENVSLRGTAPAYFDVRDFQVYAGRFFTEADLEQEARVVVLGQTTLNRLFAPDEDPLGAVVRLRGQPFRVIGIYERRGATPFGDEDDSVIVPYTTAVRTLFTDRTPKGEVRLSIIQVEYTDPASKDRLITQITDVLRETHNIPYRGEDDFTILSGQDLLSAFERVTAVLTVFLAAIASISLLVGGIGIMNIMLVSVTERTKEIGLRKAVGAKRGAILAQFLVETLVLSLLGGTLGIGLGLAIAALVTATGTISAVVTPSSVAMAF
ncbi:MAG: ABC transporter permease, partial [Anaerolineales bacterium]|nr:ABC transporter permease [Anaerolineales bacterium]